MVTSVDNLLVTVRRWSGVVKRIADNEPESRGTEDIYKITHCCAVIGLVRWTNTPRHLLLVLSEQDSAGCGRKLGSPETSSSLL